MGVALAKNGHLDLQQLISLIDSRADELNGLNQQLATLAQENDAATAGILREASASAQAAPEERLTSRSADSPPISTATCWPVSGGGMGAPSGGGKGC